VKTVDLEYSVDRLLGTSTIRASTVSVVLSLAWKPVPEIRFWHNFLFFFYSKWQFLQTNNVLVLCSLPLSLILPFSGNVTGYLAHLHVQNSVSAHEVDATVTGRNETSPRKSPSPVTSHREYHSVSNAQPLYSGYALTPGDRQCLFYSALYETVIVMIFFIILIIIISFFPPFYSI